MTFPRFVTITLLLLLCVLCVGTAFASGDGGSPDPLSFDSLKRDLGLWSFVIFVALFAVLYKFAFAPIAKGLDAREEGITGQIAAAERANTDAKQLLEQYRDKLAEADGEVKQIIDNAKQEGRRMADEIVAQAHNAATAQQKRAVAEIETATVNALQELADKSATLATSLAGRIIKKEIDPGTHRDLVNAAISNLNN